MSKPLQILLFIFSCLIITGSMLLPAPAVEPEHLTVDRSCAFAAKINATGSWQLIMDLQSGGFEIETDLSESICMCKRDHIVDDMLSQISAGDTPHYSAVLCEIGSIAQHLLTPQNTQMHTQSFWQALVSPNDGS